MNQHHYAIRSINPLSALKYGFVLGCVLMVLPGLLGGILLRQLIEALVLAISGGFFAPDLGPLTTLYQMGWGLTWWVTFLAVVGGGIVSAISSVVGALVYNLVAAISGGLEVTADLLNQPMAPIASAAFTPVSPPVAPSFPAPAPVAPSVAPRPAPVNPPVAPASPAPAPAASGGGNSWLALRDQPVQRWGLRCPVTTIGAAPGCDIVLSGLAPRHAEIRCENDRHILYDLSGGQSWVNGRQITTANLLKDGFAVRLATLELVFVC